MHAESAAWGDGQVCALLREVGGAASRLSRLRGRRPLPAQLGMLLLIVLLLLLLRSLGW